LLDEFLKAHRTVQEQKQIIAQLRHDFARLQKQVEALTAGLQKVNAQLEVSKPAVRTPQAVARFAAIRAKQKKRARAETLREPD